MNYNYSFLATQSLSKTIWFLSWYWIPKEWGQEVFWMRVVFSKSLTIIAHNKSWVEKSCGLYYKPIMTVNDDSTVINKLETSLTDDPRVVFYDGHMFIVLANDHLIWQSCPKKSVENTSLVARGVITSIVSTKVIHYKPFALL